MKKTILFLLTLLVLGASLTFVSAGMRSREIPRQSVQDVTEKRTRTPAQQKIDSQLLMAARLKRQGFATREADVVFDSAGRAAVDISGEVTNNLLATIRREGGEVVNSYPQFKAVRAYLTLESLETIADLSEVRTISRAAKAELSSTKPNKETARQSEQKPLKVKQLSSNTGKLARKHSRRKKRRRHTR